MLRAKISWRMPDEGGRKALPIGEGDPPYAAVVRFKGDNGPWPPEIAWNLVVQKIEDLGSNEWLANVAYKVAHAPHENLVTGKKFELYEGHKCVAEGVLM